MHKQRVVADTFPVCPKKIRKVGHWWELLFGGGVTSKTHSIQRRHFMMRFILPCLSLCVIYGESFAPTSRTISNERCCFASTKDEEARRFKEEANRIRAEVASFEQEKKNVELEEERKEREIISQKEKVRTRYSAEVPILKGDGSTVIERVDFAPRMKEGMVI
jgi:hypothetical protein